MATKKSNEPDFIRPGIVPGLLGMIAMFIGMALYPTEFYLYVLFAVSIMASILVVFSWQSHYRSKYVFLPLFLAIAIYWNPIFRLNEGFQQGIQWWMLVQTAAAAIFFIGAFWIKTPAPAR